MNDGDLVTPTASRSARSFEQQALKAESVKARKPYTITKQRERWTGEEHDKFLEAIRLHGRAWRRIEEHVGTKTAVQIRSHAQKFFSKVERLKEEGEREQEALEIPPPRPKRKPLRPYPRKDDNSGSGNNEPEPEPNDPRRGSSGYALPSFAANNDGDNLLQLPSTTAAAASIQHHIGCSSAPPHGVRRVHEDRRLMSHATPGTSATASLGIMDVSEATVAAVAAAASAAAAAAAAAVVAAAGKQVQAHLQAHPPMGFPFFGLPPNLLAQLSLHSPVLQALAKSEKLTSSMHPVTHAPVVGLNASKQQHQYQINSMEGAAHLLGALTEATGTTGAPMSDSSLRGSVSNQGQDGDSACSRETDVHKNAAASSEQGGSGDLVDDAAARASPSGPDQDRSRAEGSERREEGEEGEEERVSGRVAAGPYALPHLLRLKTFGQGNMESKAEQQQQPQQQQQQQQQQRCGGYSAPSSSNAASQLQARPPPRGGSAGGGAPSSGTRQGLSHAASDTQVLAVSGGNGGAAPRPQRTSQEISNNNMLLRAEQSQGLTATSDGFGGLQRCSSKQRHAHASVREVAAARSERHKEAPAAKQDLPNQGRGCSPNSGEDTNGSIVVRGNGSQRPAGKREAQGSNPTNLTGGAGHGNGSNSNGDGSNSNGDGSNNNGHGSNANGSNSNGNGCSGDGNGDGSGNEGGCQELPRSRAGGAGDGNGSGDGSGGNDSGDGQGGHDSGGNGQDSALRGGGDSGTARDSGNGQDSNRRGGGDSGTARDSGNGRGGGDSGDGGGRGGSCGEHQGGEGRNGSSADERFPCGDPSVANHSAAPRVVQPGSCAHASSANNESHYKQEYPRHHPSRGLHGERPGGGAFQPVMPSSQAAARAAASGAGGAPRAEAADAGGAAAAGGAESKEQQQLRQQVLQQLQILGAGAAAGGPGHTVLGSGGHAGGGQPGTSTEGTGALHAMMAALKAQSPAPLPLLRTQLSAGGQPLVGPTPAAPSSWQSFAVPGRSFLQGHSSAPAPAQQQSCVATASGLAAGGGSGSEAAAAAPALASPSLFTTQQHAAAAAAGAAVAELQAALFMRQQQEVLLRQYSQQYGGGGGGSYCRDVLPQRYSAAAMLALSAAAGPSAVQLTGLGLPLEQLQASFPLAALLGAAALDPLRMQGGAGRAAALGEGRQQLCGPGPGPAERSGKRHSGQRPASSEQEPAPTKRRNS